MRFHQLRQALLILGVSTTLVALAACEKSGFTRSSNKKKSNDRNTQNQTGNQQGDSPYGYSNGDPNSTAYGQPNGTNPDGSPSNIGGNQFGNSPGVNPNGFNNPGGIGSTPYNPYGFPGNPGGIGGFGGDTPLILDWNKDGKIAMSSKMVAFDINGDGMRDKTEWIASTERLLVLDINGNGEVDSGRELFGSATVNLRDLSNFSNGFLALRMYDVNKDGKITNLDPVFAKLQLWQDKNANGKSEADELSPLKGSGVIALNSLYKTLPMGQGYIRGSHSRIGFESVYETMEGQHMFADVIFHNERNAADVTAALSTPEVR